MSQDLFQLGINRGRESLFPEIERLRADLKECNEALALTLHEEAANEIERLQSERDHFQQYAGSLAVGLDARDQEIATLRAAVEYAISWIENGDTDLERRCADKLRTALANEQEP